MSRSVEGNKRIVMDVDGTLCESRASNQSYSEVRPIEAVIEKLREYKQAGFTIVLNTSRQMRTYKGNVGEINVNTLPVLITWLNEHDIPYDEIHVGKPWCGFEGFYVDDKTIRPQEFSSMSYEEIKKLLGIE